jgi:nicotinamide-nucleotide amidase
MQDKELIKLVKHIKDNIKTGITISTAESCTGGMLAACLTSISGSSEYFSTGIVSYSNTAKMKLLSVKGETLKKFGAVSEEVAKEMAMGSKKIAESDVAISITGIAGPDGGTVQKPVGMVCFGVASSGSVKSFTRHFTGNRSEVRRQACLIALQLVLGEL